MFVMAKDKIGEIGIKLRPIRCDEGWALSPLQMNKIKKLCLSRGCEFSQISFSSDDLDKNVSLALEEHWDGSGLLIEIKKES